VLHLLVRGVKDAQVQRSVVAGLSTKGELRWQVPVDGLVLSGSEPVLTREGLLVAGASGTSTEGKSSIYLIGVQTTSPGLAASSWPRHYHDNLSTGYLGTPLD